MSFCSFLRAWLRRGSTSALTGVVVLMLASSMATGQPVAPRASQALALDVVSTADRFLTCGDYGQILYRDVGSAGWQWQLAAVPTTQLLTAIAFVDDSRGWAVGHDGVIVASVDGGRHWVLQRDGLRAQQAINKQLLVALEQRHQELEAALLQQDDPQQRRQLALQLDELELDLEDAELAVAEPVHAPPLLDVYFSDPLRGTAVGAFNTLLSTTDGGANWQHQATALDNPDGYHLNAITGDGAGQLWIGAEGGLLFYSGDYGQNWESLPSPYGGSWFGIVRQPDTELLLAFGLRGNVFRSENGGKNWQPVAAMVQRTLAGGSFVGSNYVLLVGAVGTLLVSNDAGRSFTEVPVPQRVGLSSVAVSGKEVILVGQGGIYSIEPPFGVGHE